MTALNNLEVRLLFNEDVHQNHPLFVNFGVTTLTIFSLSLFFLHS